MKKILLFIKEYSYLIITFIFLLLNILLFLFTRNLNVLTTKYYLIIFGILILLEVITILFQIPKNKIFNIIGHIISIILIIINICGIYYVKVTNNFLDKAFENDNRQYTNTFYVVTLNNDENTIDNISKSNIGYYVDTPNITQAIKELNSKYEFNPIDYDNITNMFNKLGTDIKYILIEIIVFPASWQFHL